MENPEEQFIKFHDRLRYELDNVSEHLEIYKDFMKLWNEYIPELNLAPTFFAMTIDAHKYAVLMGLNRLLDTYPNHLSINKFLNFIGENLEIFSYDRFQIRLKEMNRFDELAVSSRTEITIETIKKHIELVRNHPAPHVRKWRNELLAHRQAESVLRGTKISETYPITTSKIEKAIKTIREVLDFYYLNFNATTYDERKISCGQTKRILEMIRIGNQNSGCNIK